MSAKLNLDQLQVTSFETSSALSSATDADRVIGGADSYPAMCTCIGICQPSEDLYCSGGCPPETTIPQQDFAY